ncbi:c-type heme family protein [Paraburkholderia youngii]|uniref:Tll0287-like domain-containing protein n=1 Tax=Paraburkholderia youngii TaxID=2782701 RepID=UPI003D1C8D9C
MRLSLSVKLNLMFVAIFAIGFVSAGWLARDQLQRTAVEETLQNARVLMASASAAQSYTAEQITPLLQTQMKYGFVSQSVPAYSAVEMLTMLQKDLPNYAYRSTMLDPTNPRDRPTQWEADVIQKLHDKPELSELVQTRDTPSGPTLQIGRPIRIDDAACMECHSTPSRAPKTLIDKYGPNNGFNWQMHQVIGADFVAVPMTVALARADDLLRTFMLSLAVVFGSLLLALNIMIHLLVTRRVRALSRAADEISLGKLDGPDFGSRGNDEIDSLAVSFGRMKTSLVEAFRMIDSHGTDAEVE